MHVETRQLPRNVRRLSEGAIDAAHHVSGQVSDLVEGSAAALARTAHAATAPRRRRGGVRQVVLVAVAFAVVVIASRWWARRNAPVDVPKSARPDVATPVSAFEPAEPAAEAERRHA